MLPYDKLVISFFDIKNWSDDMHSTFEKRLHLGFLQLHILHHASIHPIYGTWMMDELKDHGYDVGPSHIYPLLKELMQEGLLTMNEKNEHGKIRKYYQITSLGLSILKDLREKAQELTEEILDHHSKEEGKHESNSSR